MANKLEQISNAQSDLAQTEVKLDQGKLRYDLMPFDALDAVAEILTYGIKKYPKPEENWRVNSTKEDIARYKAARLRHISMEAQGQVYDEESGMPHEWHIATNSLFIIALEKKSPGSGDLPGWRRPIPWPQSCR